MAKKPSRRTARSIQIDTNVRCNRIYPVEGTKRSITELQSVGVRLNCNQALHLARVLLAVTQEWDEVEITAYRKDRRASDGTYPITVTSRIPD
jgi:hypothetical protein